MSQQYEQAEQNAMQQLVDELDSSIGLGLAVFGFDASDTVANDLLPLHPDLTPELSEEQRNKKNSFSSWKNIQRNQPGY